MASIATSGGREAVSGQTSVADRFARVHFVLQHEKAPNLQDVEIVALDPFLRGLLFTDGTVSRALEAQTLSPVTVAPVEQTRAPATHATARHLGVQEGTECIRRRVTMHIAEEHLAVWAESYIVPERLPPQFLATLVDTPQGIGGSLQQMKLESSRELLCFGLTPAPSWAGAGETPGTLARSYRIITQSRPAILIREHFALERRARPYRLVGSAGADGC